MRTIEYICKQDGITPFSPQYAGVQGEDCSTQAVFTIDSAVDIEPAQGHSIVARVDCTDGAGAFYASAHLEIDSNRCVTFVIPHDITRAGGMCRANLVVSELDADNVEQRIVYSGTATLYFENSAQGMLPRNQYKRELSGLMEAAADAAEIAQEAAGQLSQHNADLTAHSTLFDRKENIANRITTEYAGATPATDQRYYTAAATEKRLSAQIATHNSESVGVHPYILQSIPAQIGVHNNSETAHADIRASITDLEQSVDTIFHNLVVGCNIKAGGTWTYDKSTGKTTVALSPDSANTTCYFPAQFPSGAQTAYVHFEDLPEGTKIDMRAWYSGADYYYFGRITADGVYQIDLSKFAGENGGRTLLLDTDQSKMFTFYITEKNDEKLSRMDDLANDLNLHNTSSDAHEDIRAALENISSVTQYGVRFEGAANSGDTVTRLYDAQGLVAGVGTDTQTAVNDFDHIYPWGARRRCCGTFDETGNFVVNAYEGEAGYATDGTGGEVWVEHSLFYYKHIYDGDAEEILISAFPIGGFLPAPIFVLPDGTVSQKAYTAAYPMATVDGKATSRSGVFSDICSLNSAMTTARTLGKNYTATTTAEWYTDCLYMWVEFATRDLQSVMAGASSLPYHNTNTATVAETNVNRMIVANAVADAFVVGQTIGIGTSLGGTQIASNRVVTAIDVYDADNKAISFDGSPVNIAVGNIVWSSVYINGTCDHVLSSSGSPVSNTSGKYNCIYRGKETPYGNAFEWISDILLKREGGGTIEDPYIYDIYYLPDPAKYANGVITDDYIKLNYQLPADDGYIKKLGFDSRYPHLRLPAQLGGSSSAYYTDYYYPPANDICAAHVGGFVSYGKNDGPCYWYCHYQPTLISNSRRARLSYRRGNLSGSSTLDSLGVTATAAELNYCDGLTGNIQNQIDALADGDPTTPIDGGTF